MLDDKSPRIMQQISLFDARTGEVLRQTTRKLGPNLEEDWTIMYNDAMLQLVLDGAPPAALRIFIALAVSQDYDGCVHATKSYMGQWLGYTKQTWVAAFKYLEQRDYIRVSKVKGCSLIRINPTVATKGRDRAKKIDLWTQQSSVRQVGNKVRRSLPLD